MPALNYCKENIEKYNFEYKIIHLIKKHTIRRYGPGLLKRPFKIGDTLYHYKNWRKKNPRPFKFCENKCLYVADIKIYETPKNEIKFRIKINNYILNGTNCLNLAINDGFDNFQQFKDFFIKAGLPFNGQIIGWKEGIDYS